MTEKELLQGIDDGIEGNLVFIDDAVGVKAGLFVGIGSERPEPIVYRDDG